MNSALLAIMAGVCVVMALRDGQHAQALSGPAVREVVQVGCVCSVKQKSTATPQTHARSMEESITRQATEGCAVTRYMSTLPARAAMTGPNIRTAGVI